MFSPCHTREFPHAVDSCWKGQNCSTDNRQHFLPFSEKQETMTTPCNCQIPTNMKMITYFVLTSL